MSTLRVEPLYRRDLGAGDRADRRDAGPSSSPLHMHSAGPTHANPATEFGSCKTKLVANHPEQGGVIRTVHRNGAAIEVECGHNRMPPLLYSVSAMPSTPGGQQIPCFPGRSMAVASCGSDAD